MKYQIRCTTVRYCDLNVKAPSAAAARSYAGSLRWRIPKDRWQSYTVIRLLKKEKGPGPKVEICPAQTMPEEPQEGKQYDVTLESTRWCDFDVDAPTASEALQFVREIDPARTVPWEYWRGQTSVVSHEDEDELL